MAILPGATAPDFRLRGWAGGAEQEYRLSEQRGRTLVLAFYPGDERLVCTRQMCAYSDGLDALSRAATTLWAIAPQGVESHRRFAEGRHLAMPLLADTDSEVARAFGVQGAFGLRRSVFLVDPEGSIVWRWVSTLNVTFPGVDVLREAIDATRDSGD